MTETNTPANVRDYLADLEAAMIGIPEETTRDIVGAIREELFGLDAAAAATRIRRFGDPQFIASEARAADAGNPSPMRGQSRRWFPFLILAAMLFGGLIIAFWGTAVGFVMMWCSNAWTRPQKWIATIVPVVTFLTLYAATVLQRAALGPGEMARFHIEPLIPSSALVAERGLTIQIAALTAVCIALLWLAFRNRTVRERSTS